MVAVSQAVKKKEQESEKERQSAFSIAVGSKLDAFMTDLSKLEIRFPALDDIQSILVYELASCLYARRHAR